MTVPAGAPLAGGAAAGAPGAAGDGDAEGTLGVVVGNGRGVAPVDAQAPDKADMRITIA
jgi:hypothetical protein